MKYKYTTVLADNCDLNKQYNYVNGEVKKTAIANMSKGAARVSSYDDFNQFYVALASLKSNEAIVLGIPKDGRLEATLVTKGNEEPDKNIISKSNDYFIYTNPATGLIDYDAKGIPSHLRICTYSELYDAIILLIPELAGKTIYIKLSSSGGILLPNGEPLSSEPSFHAYFTMENLNEKTMQILLDNIYWNAIKNNKYFLKIFKNGGSTLSTQIDEAVLKSLQSRIVFEAEATTYDGLTKKFDPGIIYNGETMISLDLNTLKPRDVKLLKASLLQAERLKHAAEIERVKVEYGNNKRLDLASKGFDAQRIEKIIATNIEKMMISGSETIVIENGVEILIHEAVFSCGGSYMADPLEPDKGYNKAVFNRHSIFNADFYSYLDGGKTYKVDFDLEDMMAIVSDGRFNESIFTAGVQRALKALLIEKDLPLAQLKEVISVLVSKNLVDMQSFQMGVLRGIIERKACDIMTNYAVVKSKGKVGILDIESRDMESYKLQDTKTFMLNKGFWAIDPESEKLKEFDPVAIWLRSKNRKEYHGIEFISTKKSELPIYQIFKGFAHIPKYTIDIRPFLNFIYETICSCDMLYYNVVITFFAQIVQQPHVKHNTALGLFGGKGIGKSTFIKAMSIIFEGYYLTTADSGKILGQFNHHIGQTLLCYANESFFIGDRKNEGKLKNFISESETTYEIKGGAIFTGKNFARLVIDSNDDSVIKESADERRFITPKPSTIHQGDHEYFSALYALIEHPNFAESLMYFLLFFDISPYEVYLKHPPRNEINIEQQLLNLSDIESWWLACLQEGEILGVRYNVEGEYIRIANSDMFESYRRFVLAKHKRVYESIENFGKMLKKHVLDQSLIIAESVKFDEKNAKIIGSLKSCQEYFVKKQKLGEYAFENDAWKIRNTIDLPYYGSAL